MTAVIMRWKSFINDLPVSKENTVCSMQEFLKTQDHTFFTPLVENHTLLSMEYSIFCIHLVNELLNDERNNIEKLKLLTDALMMAEILAHTYKHCLMVPREATRLEIEQQAYRNLLNQINVVVQEPEDLSKTEPDFVTEFIRDRMGDLNWYRLFLLRSKRVLNACVPLLTSFESYCQFIALLDKHLNPIISYLSWVFFLPRLCTNLFLLFKHLIPGDWMDESEKNLGFLVRLQAQMQRRWFQLANDSVWMVAGVLNCFVWLGTLAPVGIYINVMLFVYDVLLATIRAAIELSRLTDLRAQYQEIAERMENKDSDEYSELVRLQEHLDERIAYEFKRQLLPVANTLLLTLGTLLCLPAALALSPILPLIGACLLVMSTATTFLLTQVLQNHAPKPQCKVVDLLNNNGIFKTNLIQNSSSSDSEESLPPPLNPNTLVLNHTSN